MTQRATSTLETAPQTQLAAAFRAPLVVGASGVHVLVVDDDSDMRNSLRELLESHGMRVDTAANGLSAATHGFRIPYDVVLSDIRMPGMSGIALARSLQRCRRPPSVILITAFPEWKVVQEAYEAGASEVIRKPFDLERLAARVGLAALERSKNHEEYP